MDSLYKTKKQVKWEILETKELLHIDSRLTISVQKVKLPDGRIINDYYHVEFPHSVITVARTIDDRVVMSRQYLHGYEDVSMVLPAGTTEKGEDPLETAKRELLEETGYASDDWKYLGAMKPHTNYGCGKVYFFYAANAKIASEPDSVDLEEMEIVLLHESEIINAIKNKNIISIGTITALSLAKIYLQGENYYAK